ncbi:MAG TPA: alpha/beta fold hydrolase [Gemmatimonadales bacterium]|nr:alpha/beta fold hydrolase [Gemmatimonadales bacterium]
MTRPRILLLHGGLGARDQMAPLVAGLEATLEAVSLDLPGHGSADLAGGGFDIQTMRARVVHELESWHLGRVAVFGYSMGGYVALEVARRRPDLVSTVITLGTKFDWTPESAAKESRHLDAGTIRAKVPYFADQLEQRHTALGWEAVLTHTAAMMTSLGNDPVLNPDKLREVHCPVRVMVGDKDLTVSVEESLAASRAMERGELEVLPGVAHPFEKAPLDKMVRSIVEVVAGIA